MTFMFIIQNLEGDGPVSGGGESEVGREALLRRERGDVAAMLKEQDSATPGGGSAGGGSIKSEPPTVKEEPENGDHSEDKKDLNGTECKNQSKFGSSTKLGF